MTPTDEVLDGELRSADSHLVVYQGNKKVVDRTTCGRCGLTHIPPITHELHEIYVAGVKEILACDDCAYGNPGPHITFANQIDAYYRKEKSND